MAQLASMTKLIIDAKFKKMLRLKSTPSSKKTLILVCFLLPYATILSFTKLVLI